MNSSQLKQKLAELKAELAAKERKLELKSRLQTLKKEYEKKQRKLERAGRVAKIRAHVKSRLADLKIPDANSVDGSNGRVADQKGTHCVLQNSKGADQVLGEEQVKGNDKVLSELHTDVVSKSKSSQSSGEVCKQIVIRCTPKSLVSPITYDDSCKPAQVDINDSNAQYNLLCGHSSEDKQNILLHSEQVPANNQDTGCSIDFENKTCDKSQRDYSQCTPIKRKVSSSHHRKRLSLQQNGQSQGGHGERSLASYDSGCTKPPSQSEITVNNEDCQASPGLSKQSESEMTSQQRIPRIEDDHIVSVDKPCDTISEKEQKHSSSDNQMLYGSVPQLPPTGQTAASVAVSSQVTAQSTKTSTDKGSRGHTYTEISLSQESISIDVSQEPETVNSTMSDSQLKSESSQPTRKRPYRRADWACVLPPRKSARLAASHTCAALDQSFLQVFSPESQLSGSCFNCPVQLPRWHEGLSQVSLTQKRKRSRKLFPSLPKIVIEQHCFDANFVEFSLPVEDFKQFLPHIANSNKHHKCPIAAQKGISLGSHSKSSQSVITRKDGKLFPILLELERELNDTETSFEEFSLPIEDFKDFLPQKLIPCSPTDFPVLSNSVDVSHTSEKQAEQEVKSAPEMSGRCSACIGTDPITHAAVLKSSQIEEDVILISQPSSTTCPVTTNDVEGSFSADNKNSVTDPLNSSRKDSHRYSETHESNSEEPGTYLPRDHEDIESNRTGKCARTVDAMEIPVSTSPTNLLCITDSANMEQVLNDHVECALLNEGYVHRGDGTDIINATTHNPVQDNHIGAFVLKRSVQHVPAEVSAGAVERSACSEQENYQSQPSVIQETQEMSDDGSADIKVNTESKHEHHSSCQVDKSYNITPKTAEQAMHQSSPVITETPVNQGLSGESQVNTSDHEMNTDVWDVKDSFKVEVDQINCLVPGNIEVDGEMLQHIVVVGNSGVSVWIQKALQWENRGTWSAVQEITSATGFTVHSTCTSLLCFVLLNNHIDHSSQACLFSCKLDGSSLENYLLLSADGIHTNGLIGSDMGMGQFILGRCSVDTCDSHVWKHGVIDNSKVPLEAAPGEVQTVLPLKGRQAALIGYSRDFRFHIWNHEAGLLLTTINLNPAPDFLAGKIDVVTVTEVKGLVYAALVTSINSGQKGCVMAVNPSTHSCKVLHSFDSPDVNINRVEGNRTGTCVVDGTLKSWDYTQITQWNLFSGQLEGWASIPKTAVQLTFWDHRLYMAEKTGWVHVISTI